MGILEGRGKYWKTVGAPRVSALRNSCMPDRPISFSLSSPAPLIVLLVLNRCVLQYVLRLKSSSTAVCEWGLASGCAETQSELLGWVVVECRRRPNGRREKIHSDFRSAWSWAIRLQVARACRNRQSLAGVNPPGIPPGHTQTAGLNEQAHNSIICGT
ncbi:hypothetical protein M409DRAFT_53132 [Zasmidium cellare ATCC 36951]|uniref:Uncharacterized protein n=1 Tax=Zasmidium cellare ATCC 36951 TaxID=1080233 RepID=A0A6A6CQG1_ZASCE|nr:uncharacterized protein M409DRAFT_53132 [Zasmidium cellare ATCC 36951]KAF2168458.1 hypothetical protein M409DRAFT_53132 [Zasmidium cellare ATCC 36951]